MTILPTSHIPNPMLGAGKSSNFFTLREGYRENDVLIKETSFSYNMEVERVL